MRHALTASLLAVLATAAHAQSADVPKNADTTVQQQLQKRVQADTDQTVRRINTMLRAMAFHKIDQAEENKILGDLAGTLSSLSKEQMSQVVAKLEEAAKGSDEKKTGADLEDAYKRHREILDHLNRLLSRYDAVRSLDQAAERMDQLSRDEIEIFLQNAQLTREARQMAVAIQKAEETVAKEQDEAKKKNFEQAAAGYRKRIDRVSQPTADKLSDDQGDVQRQSAELFRQLGELKPQLPAEHQDRLAKVEAAYKARKVALTFEESIQKLRARIEPEKRHENWKGSGAAQWKVSGDLRELARALRAPVEDLDALREARQLLDQAIERQTGLKEEAVIPPASKEWERMERRARDLGDRQARIEFDARDTKALLKPISPKVAAKIEPAEAAMREAQDALREQQAKQAAPVQDKAVAMLKEALKDLDQVIQQAEKAKEDPIAALKALSESIEKLIQDQKETKQKTEEKKKDANEVAKIAPEQKQLSDRTKELGTQPLPDKKIDQALEKAAQAMDKAKENLDSKKAPEATANQEKAIAALEEAKKAADQALAKAEAAQDQSIPNAAQEVAKAIEQTQKAQENAQQAEKSPSLAEMQKNLADKAKQQNQPAEKAANEAAKALEKGDLKKAIQEQAKALAQLHEAAAAEAQAQPQGEKGEGEKAQGEKPQGEKGQGEKPQGEKPQGEKGQGEKPQQSAQLEKQQAELLAATQALANSEMANQEAQQAVGQAQALAPQGVQPQLGQAQKALGQAMQALQQPNAAQAAENQGQALEQLNQALNALNAQLAAQGKPEVHPGQPQAAGATPEPGQGQGQEPGQGQGQGQEPGQGQGQGQKPGQGQGQGQEPGQGQGQQGKSQEQNQQQGKGDRNPDGTLKNTASSLVDAKGGDSFLYLPPRQRELIRQALSEGLPPEYSAQIQQYYVNLARGRAASTPATEKKK